MQDRTTHDVVAGRTWITHLFAWVGGLSSGLMRLIPHPANFTSIGGMAIFSGSRLRSSPLVSFGLPIIIMLVTDFGLFLATGFDPLYSPLHISRVYVYASILGYVAIGRWLVRQVTPGRVLIASTLGSMQFFLMTNLCEWLFQPLQAALPDAYRYSRDLAGLAQCFAYALPFVQSDAPYTIHQFIVGDVRLGFYGLILGDLAFCGVFFGLHVVMERGRAATVAQPEHVATPAN